MSQGRCPVCNYGKYERLRLSSYGADVEFRIHNIFRPARLIVCKKCGVIRVDGEGMAQLDRKEN